MRLVLEGGGVRAAYSAGVCKALRDAGVRCDVVIGSSAGSLNAAFYASGQTDVLCDLWAELTPHRNLISWRRHLTPFAGPGLGIDILLDDILVGEAKLDLDAATSGNPDLYITATQASRGEGKVSKPTRGTLIEWVRASLALPGAYNRLVEIDGEEYVDGGVATPVPFDVAELAAYPGPTVVVLTRRSSTRKRAPSWYERLFVQLLVPARARGPTLKQYQLHNSVMRQLEAAEARGDVIVSNPPEGMPLGRLTTDEGRVLAGIQQGVEVGQELAQRLNKDAAQN